MFDINIVNEQVNFKGALINAPKELLWVRVSPSGDGSPHVEITNDKAFYIASERGMEIFRKEAHTLDELLFFIFKDIVCDMASDFELKNRIPEQDSRRIRFKKRLGLLEKINPKWVELERKEIEKILERAPFSDALPNKL